MVFIIFAFLFSAQGCTKSAEKSGDAFLKSAQKAKSKRVREEREKKAYLKYLKAADNQKAKAKPVGNSLREKILKLTIKRLNRELKRLQENPEEANLDQMMLWRQDFSEYLPGLANPEISKEYSRFLLSLADSYIDPEAMDLSAAFKIHDGHDHRGGQAQRA